MKKPILVFLLLLSSIQFGQAQVLISILLGDKLNSGKIEFGLEGGINFSSMNGLESSSSRRDLNLGFYFDFLLKEGWYLNTGVLVKSSVGADKLTQNDLALLDPTFAFGDTGTYAQDIRYFHVPIAVKYRFKNHFYVLLGSQLALRTKAKVEFEGELNGKEVTIDSENSDAFKRIDAGVLGGVGYKLRQGTGMNIGLKYFYAFTDSFKDNAAELNNSSLYLYLNVPIGRGKASKTNKTPESGKG